MPHTSELSLPTFPVELLHRIFDDLDGSTVLLSVRNVSRQLKAVVDAYDRYTLDFTSISKPDFYRLLRVVRPESVTTLVLSDQWTSPGQTSAFQSLVDIHHFTRLRSLTLLDVDALTICMFLEHARRCSLTSLKINKTSFNLSHRIIMHQLSCIVAQPTLRHLYLFNEYLYTMLHRIRWPANCKLRRLHLQNYLIKCLPVILHHARELETLVVMMQSVTFLDERIENADLFSTPYPRLTSLTLLDFTLTMHTALLLLAQTPSLRHLKIKAFDKDMADAPRWEHLIKSKLPSLDKFEIHIRFPWFMSDMESVETAMFRMITPFSTPFWTSEKRWSVTCNWFLDIQSVEIYTAPIDFHFFHPSMMTITNSVKADPQHEPTWQQSSQVHLGLIEHASKEDTQKLTTDLWFPKVTDLTVTLNYWSSLSWLPPVTDLSRVTKVSLRLLQSLPSDQNGIDCMGRFLQQMPNIRSLGFVYLNLVYQDSPLIGHACLAVMHHVKRSTLKHLDIPISNTDHAKMLLERFRGLLSINFQFASSSILIDTIFGHLATLTSNCLASANEYSIAIWLGKRLESASYL